LWKTLFNTLYYAFGTVPLNITIGLILALLVNRKLRWISIFRTIYFLPVIISGVATILMWNWIFNSKYGLINAFLNLIGIQGPAWLQDERWAMPALIFMSIWGVGVNMVIYVAALQGLPKELIDSAELDGANKWNQFRYIIWPLITPVTFYLIIVNIIASFQVFTPTYILTKGGPNNATLTFPLYIYFNAFSWNRLGYASSLAFISFIMILLFTIFQFRFAKRWVFYRGSES
jgi:multiple sugar transport system permease protein